jgi:hypothetical protein
MQLDRFAREIVAFLALSYAARLRRLMRGSLAGVSMHSVAPNFWPASKARRFIRSHFLAYWPILQYHASNRFNDEDRMPTVLRVGRFRFYFFSNEG